MKGYLIRILKYLIILVIVSNLFALCLDSIIRNSSIFKPNRLFNDSNLSQNVILGSSRALTGVNTKILINETKESWVNLSIDDTPLEVHLLQLKLLIENGNIPKSIILQYDRGLNPENRLMEFSDRDYQFLPYTYKDSGKIIWNYLKFKEKGFGALMYTVPVLKYVYFNTELFFPAMKLLFSPKYMHRSDELGDYAYPDNQTMKFASSATLPLKDTVYVNDKDSLYVEFVKICEFNKIKLFTFTAPYKNSVVKYSNAKSKIINLGSWLDEPKYFYDDLHITASARDSITRELINRIKML